jgi:DnaK suppressor protein
MDELRRTSGENQSGLTGEELAELRRRLNEERDPLVRRLKDRRQLLAGAAAREPDDADWASASADQSLLARLVDRDAKHLMEVERALAKLEAGTYGICEVTGEPIGFERLRVRPWARHSLAAKELIEREAVNEAPARLVDRVA